MTQRFVRYLIVGIIALFTQPLRLHANALKIESAALAFADGKGIGVGTTEIGITSQLVLGLMKMQHGKKSPSGELLGIFLFNNTLQTLTSLRTLEADWETAWFAHVGAGKKLASAGAPAIAEHKAQEVSLLTEKALLQATLEQVKKHFEQIVAVSIQSSRGMKPLTLQLIKISCANRGIGENSFLFTWGQAQEGHEMDAFHKNMTTFKALDIFITELSNFLQDFIFSCPKARAQYMEMVKSQSHH